MGKRRKNFPVLRKEDHDVQTMFVDAALVIARNAAILDAYRLHTGVLVRLNRTPEARASLSAAAEECYCGCDNYVRGDWARAMQHAAKHAMLSYVGQWWTTSHLLAPPRDLAEGDEFFSRDRVRRIIELHETTEPNMIG